jgi:hypothetical protein
MTIYAQILVLISGSPQQNDFDTPIFLFSPRNAPSGMALTLPASRPWKNSADDHS